MKDPSQSADADSSPLGEPRLLPSPAVGKVGGEAARMRVIQLAIIAVTLLLCAVFSTSSGRFATTFSSRRRLSNAGGVINERPPCVKGDGIPQKCRHFCGAPSLSSEQSEDD